MKRELKGLADREFDLAIIGGGIFGTCAAWDAALRGLSVALVEREDFAAGVSANSFKMVHGGIRYLQHADLGRLRASCRERSALLRIAPHLVQPLPIVIPTYGHGRQGKAFLGTGMGLYDLLTLGRNRAIADHSRRIPWTRVIGRNQVLEFFPGLESRGLTGGAVFCDGQMYNPTRLVWAFVRSALDQGAEAANYVEATQILVNGSRVRGVRVRDRVSGQEFDIRSKSVLNAAGPWAERLLGARRGVQMAPNTYSRDACFLVRRRFSGPCALAIAGRTRDPDAILSRAARHLFIVPWRDWSLIGVWHVVYGGEPDDVTVTEQDVEGFIEEANWAYPALELSLDDVLMWNAGLVPFGENEVGAVDLRYGKRSILIDHQRDHGIDGLVTLIGIRYTMARGDSAKAVDLICRQLRRHASRPPTERIPVHGGKVQDFDGLVETAGRRLVQLPRPTVRSLVHNYGSEYEGVVRLAEGEDPTLLDPLGQSSVLKAEVLHAIRYELAVRLADVVFRRTDLATGGEPDEAALVECARIMGEELHWNDAQIQQEIRTVRNRFPMFGHRGRNGSMCG